MSHKQKARCAAIATLALGTITAVVVSAVLPTSREPQLVLPGHAGYVQAVAFSPDGATIASGSVNIRLWNSATGALERVIQQGSGEITGLTFTPDGEGLIASTGWGVVALWDLTEREEHRTILTNSSGSVLFALAPDGRTLAVNYSEAVRAAPDDLQLWDVVAGERLQIIEKSSRARSWTFSPDGAILAAGYPDGTVKLWELSSGELRATIRAASERSEIYRIAFSPDGRTIAVPGDQDEDGVASEVRLWDVETMQERLSVNSGKHDASDFAFSPDGSTLAITKGRTVDLRDTVTGESKATLISHGSRHVRCLAFSPHGARLAGGTTHPIRLLRLQSGGAEVNVWHAEPVEP